MLHHTDRFTSLAELASDPLQNARTSFPRLAAGLLHYLPAPALLFALASFVYLAVQRSTGALIVVAVSIIPIAFQVLVLSSFSPRFAYPHMWPWMLAMGLCAGDLWRRWRERWTSRLRLLAAATTVALAAGSMALLSIRILRDPRGAIEPGDSGQLFGSYVHLGWGVPEAIDLLASEARRRGGFVLLTDPFWGVPADMAFAYLNQRHGIRVHEAWWLQLEGNLAIMPNSRVELVKSHYERVKGGVIDFREVERVYYLTDTFYMSRAAVQARQPGAVLLKSFPKPDGNEWVDVYRFR